MPKITITVTFDGYEEAMNFLNGRAEPIDPPIVIEPPVVIPVEPPVIEEPIEEPEVIEPPIVPPIEEPEVSIEIIDNLPPMASKGFDLTQDLTNALPLLVRKDDVIALKLQKVVGWVWSMENGKNVNVLMPFQDYLVVKCSQSNTETYANFVMLNQDDVMGASLHIDFAVAN